MSQIATINWCPSAAACTVFDGAAKQISTFGAFMRFDGLGPLGSRRNAFARSNRRTNALEPHRLKMG
jgi:hypothetical protein